MSASQNPTGAPTTTAPIPHAPQAGPPGPAGEGHGTGGEGPGLNPAAANRGGWGSRLGFVLAAAGSAVGLGNIWKFPYIAGENGGGLFILIYLASIALIALPIMVAEILLGRITQTSPVGAFEKLAGKRSAWVLLGWLGTAAGFVILSYYAVVAGWVVNYVLLSISDFTHSRTADEIAGAFGILYTSGDINLFFQAVVMLMTAGAIWSGVQDGIERWNKALMPALFVLLAALVVYSMFLPGFGETVRFALSPDASKLKASGVLEAVGHSFFSLSLGMGAMLTYGSYLQRDSDVPGAALTVATMDTVVSILAIFMIFPAVFSFGMPPSAGPGLVFKSLPLVFAQMPGGMLLSIAFFTLVLFAAITSTISLLEIVSAYFIDSLGWSRHKAVMFSTAVIFVVGIPSALSGSGGLFANWEKMYGKNFFDTFDYLASNWMLPIGGLGIAVFTGWVVPRDLLEREFRFGSRFSAPFFFNAWYWLLRIVVPTAMTIVLLTKIGIVKV
jgi:neurotransmitter:Na+ symporter, NSS family